MASHTSDQGTKVPSKVADQVKASAAGAVKSAVDAVNDSKGRAADRLDQVADTIADKGNSAPDPGPRYAHAPQETIRDAADYVRDTDARQMGRDAMHAATASPVTSLLIVSAVVIGGSLLVAAMMRNERTDSDDNTGRRRPMGLSPARGLGPKGTETLIRIRDAALGFAMAKAIDSADQIFPGFREHYDRG
jgi:hypothetical protein